MLFSLKLSSVSDGIDPNIISDLRDNIFHDVILSTSKKDIIPDRKDPRFINTIRNVKIVFKKQEGGVLILMGHLQTDYKPPMGGSFFCRRIIQESTDFASIKGVEAQLRFCYESYSLTDNRVMQINLEELNNHPDFEFNIGQFDEFMEIFEFYKGLSDELNNNITYQVLNQSQPYYFIPFEIKEFDSPFKEEVLDSNGVIKGYRCGESDYFDLKNSIKEHVHKLIDIRIKSGS